MNLSAHLGLECSVTDPARISAAAGLCAAEPSPRKRSKPQHDLAGYTSTRIILEFARWAFERESFPTVGDIVRRFNVSKATAYRWRNELGQALRLEALPPNGGVCRASKADVGGSDGQEGRDR